MSEECEMGDETEVKVPRCRFVSLTPWGSSQCVLPDGHEERHAFSPSEGRDDILARIDEERKQFRTPPEETG